MTTSSDLLNLRNLLVRWRNAPDDVWFVDEPTDTDYFVQYSSAKGEQELLISIISKLVETKFEERSPEITTYVLPEWNEEGNLKEVLSGTNGQAIADRVERGGDDEYFVVAAAGDNDSRPPYVVYLARGGMKWSDGWIRLGATNNNWDEVANTGLFGNLTDRGEEAVLEKRMEDIENDDSFWSNDGSLGWALKIKFVDLQFITALNWKEWPETLLAE